MKAWGATDTVAEPKGWTEYALTAWQERGASGRANASMREYTTFRIGGPADLLLMPRHERDVAFARQLARELGQPLSIFGACSNLLVLDGGIRGIVLRTAGSWESLRVEGGMIRATAGTRLPLLAATARRAGLSGLEFCAVIPGTVGGALTQNAGAGQQCMADVFASARVYDEEGRVEQLAPADLAFGHRTSALHGGRATVLEAEFAGIPDEPERIAARMQEHRRRRRERLPLSKPSAGSVFRHPGQGHPPVGLLIEQAGCKGWRCGDAVVSEKHANFIVNEGKAAARDVLDLIARVSEAVRQTSGLELQSEICIVGDPA